MTMIRSAFASILVSSFACCHAGLSHADTIWIAPLIRSNQGSSTAATSSSSATSSAAATFDTTPPDRASSNTSSSWYAEPIVRRQSNIVSWDRKIVVTQDAGSDQQQSYAASRIVHAAAEPVNPPEQNLINAISTGDDRAVLKSLTAAIQSRPPVWRQQWYTVWAIVSVAKIGRFDIAYNLIQQIDALELPPLVIARLPIAWSGTALTSDTSDVDHDALQSDSAAVRLVAASRLLDVDPGQAIQTLAKLKELRSRPAISALAEIMFEIAGSGSRIGNDWQTHLNAIDAMPIILQDGPVEMLAARCRRYGAQSAADELDQRHRYASIHRPER